VCSYLCVVIDSVMQVYLNLQLVVGCVLTARFWGLGAVELWSPAWFEIQRCSRKWSWPCDVCVIVTVSSSVEYVTTSSWSVSSCLPLLQHVTRCATGISLRAFLESRLLNAHRWRPRRFAVFVPWLRFGCVYFLKCITNVFLSKMTFKNDCFPTLVVVLHLVDM